MASTVNISWFLFSSKTATCEKSRFLVLRFSLGILTIFFTYYLTCFFLSLFIQEHHIQTNYGPVSVAVYGDHDKPALVTYPDIALNRKYYPHV